MNRNTILVLAALVVGGFLAVGGVAATQDGQFDATDVQPAQQGNLTFGDQATASSTFTDTGPSTPGVVVESVDADVDSAVVVTYPDQGLQAGDQVTVDLDNVGSSAWEVNGVGGDADSVDDVVVNNVENPTLVFVEGVEYTFTDLPGASFHPLEFFDGNGDALLSQSGDGSFEDDPAVGWEDTDDTVSFTATEALVAELDGYICTIHSSMEGGVQTTDETTTDLVIAGLELFNASELVGGNVAVPVDDVGGFPGAHTAHLVPEANLSQDYSPGDIVSNETASAVVANEQATVFQGSLTFETQTVDGPVQESDLLAEVATANLLDGGGNNTAFVVDIHPTDDQGNLVAGEFVGASDVLSGTNSGVQITAEQVPDNGEFNGFPLNGSNEYVAMMHLVDDGAQPGDPASPGEYPLLSHASATGFVTGGVTDEGTVTATAQSGDIPLNTTVDPGTQFDENNFTYTVNATGVTEDTDIQALLVDFNETSGINTAAITESQVTLTADGIGDPGVDSVQQNNPGELIITPGDSFTLDAVDGELVVTVDAVVVPESGGFETRIEFQNDAGEPAATGVDSYAIGELEQSLAFADQSIEGETVVAESVQSGGVESAVIVTYESGGDLVVAGLTTGTFDNETVGVDIEDTGGLPGEHTAHIVPVAGLSQDYDTGDVVSAATADNISDQSTGTVRVVIIENGDPATDTTGDGRLNDLDGDGEFDIVDVQVLFDNLGNPTVQSNPLLFDFLGEADDRVSIFDVQALFVQSREQ